MRGKQKRFWGAFIITIMLVVTSLNLSARHNQIDLTGTALEEGAISWTGEMTLASNLDFTIDSEEKYQQSATTGTGALESQIAVQSELPGEAEGCATMQLDQSIADYDDIMAQSESTDRSTASYTNDQQCSVAVVTGMNEDGSDVIELKNVTCLSIGEYCTVWSSNPDIRDNAVEIAKQFDDFFLSMKVNFGTSEAIDVDRDGKVAIVLSDFYPDYAGYFWSMDLKSDSFEGITQDPMDRININLNLLKREGGIQLLYNTLCHEYQHLINYAVVGNNSDTWLNETFSQNASEICGVVNTKDETYTNLMVDYIIEHGYTPPFIFQGDYVPNNAVVYAQWYLFGRYLSAQTEGLMGGGDGIYKAVLNATDEAGNKKGCTTKTLTEVLSNKGVLSAGTSTATFEDFVLHYNLALVLQDTEGIYSFHGLNVTEFEYPIDAAPKELWPSLPGGGSMTLAHHPEQTEYTVTDASSSIRFTGISKDIPEAVTANYDSEKVLTIGDNLVLSAEEGTTIYYTMTPYSDESEEADESEEGDPTPETGMKYTEPLSIKKNMFIQAVAYDQNQKHSAVGAWLLYVKPDVVTASVASGHVKAESEITLSCSTEGATILYTTDGSDPFIRMNNEKPVVNGQVYDSRHPIIITENTTVRTMAYMEDQLQWTNVGAVVSYEYIADPVIQDRYEANDSLGEATAVSFPTRFTACISTKADVDYYAFTLDAVRSLNLTLSVEESNLKYNLTLLDEKGKMLQSGRGSVDQSITTTDTPAGHYFICVESRDGAFSDSSSYTLSLEKRAESVNAVDLSEMNMAAAYADVSSPNMTTYAQKNVLLRGGYSSMAVQYFTLDGPVSEEVQPYSDESTFVTFKKSKPEYHLRQSLELPNRETSDYIQTLKNSILNYGAADTDFYVYQTAFDDSCKNFYAWEDYPYDTNQDGYHETCVVGWDDNYSRENFTGNEKIAKLFGYDSFAYKIPENDGAFLCKNSWGENSGEQGIFYISYEDAAFVTGNPVIYIADEQPDVYQTQYYNDQYGAMGTMSEIGSMKAGEVFRTGDTEEQLEAVSFYTASADCFYDVYIRIDDASDPQHLMQVSKKYGGYYVERLSTPITLPANTRYEIIVRCESQNPDGKVTMKYTTGSSTYVQQLKKYSGISYYYEKDGTVLDIGEDMGRYMCIRAFTNGGTSGNILFSAGEDTDAKEQRIVYQNGTENANEEGSIYGAAEPVPIETLDTTAPDVTLPSAFDLREIGAVTSAKNQGKLGTCWIFGSIASMESTLLRTGLNAYDYVTGITIDQSETIITLGEGQQNLSLTAQDVGADNPTSKIINWSFEGDLDSIDILTNTSSSGEAVNLIQAKAAGTVTITATSDANVNQTASCTLTIKDPEKKKDTTAAHVKNKPVSHVNTGDSNIGVWVFAGLAVLSLISILLIGVYKRLKS